MGDKQYSTMDRVLINLDQALRTLALNHEAGRPAPAATEPDQAALSEVDRKHVAGLMRVNHTGEVMAQALYQGQALTARHSSVRAEMEQAAREETDHLAWCEERLQQLGSHTSRTNPLWYGLSFGMGAAAGLMGDRVSLGFVAAIEDQVCEHLQSHLQKLPVTDSKSRAIVEQMLEDEARHSRTAKAAGGLEFPKPVKQGMSLLSRLMTESSYRI